MTSTFADRLWWARHRKGRGADTLSQRVGCAQSLISSIERNNRDRSKYSNEFAKVLEVDPHWLQFGSGNAPPGFDEKAARAGREAPKKAGQLFRPQFGTQETPGWARQEAILPSQSPADARMQPLMVDFMAFARDAGKERTKALLKSFDHVLDLIFFEEAEGKK